MSQPTPPGAATSPDAALPASPRRATWVEKLTAVLVCVFCLEVGAFLLVYPWMDAWAHNYLLQFRPNWTPFLLSQQFRGAVSGLGVLNIFIAISEVFRLRRFAGRTPERDNPFNPKSPNS